MGTADMNLFQVTIWVCSKNAFRTDNSPGDRMGVDECPAGWSRAPGRKGQPRRGAVENSTRAPGTPVL